MLKQNLRRPATIYPWIILLVLTVGMGATFGMRVSFGAYISAWENDFSASRSAVTSISTLSLAVFALGQPLVGRLNDYFGKNTVPCVSLLLVFAGLFFTSRAGNIWQVYILYGFLFSLGFSGYSNVIAAAIITSWFEEKRGLALGLSSAGMAIGQLVLVPVNQLLIDSLGWRSTLSLLSVGIMVITAPLFLFALSRRPEEKGMKPYGHKESGDTGISAGSAETAFEAALENDKKPPLVGLFRHSAFWLLMTIFFICGFTDVGLIHTHLFPISEARGFSDGFVALAFSVMAVANIAGSILTGHLTDRFDRKRQLAVIYTLRAAAYIFLILIRRAWLLFPFAVVFGFVDMASGAPTTSLVADIFKKYSIGGALGIISLSHHLGGAVGAWIPGLLYDLTGSYTPSLIFSALLLVISAALSLRLSEPRRGI